MNEKVQKLLLTHPHNTDKEKQNLINKICSCVDYRDNCIDCPFAEDNSAWCNRKHTYNLSKEELDHVLFTFGLHETMYDRIKRMTPDEMRQFIYWVYRNGNEDGKTNSCDSPGAYFGGAMLHKDVREVMPNNKVEELWDSFEEIYGKE